MDFCDKCKGQIDPLEPCFKVKHGFLNTDKSFTEMAFVIIHLDCCSDNHLLTEILDRFDKN